MDLTEAIKNRVRKVIIQALPKEQVDEFIQHEFDYLFEKRDRGYHNRKTSEFERMVQEQLTELIKAEIKQWLNENFKKVFDEKTGTEQVVLKVTTALVPMVQEALTRSLIGQVLQELQSKVH